MPDRLPEERQVQDRRASGDQDNSALQQRGDMPHVKDWDDLLSDHPQQSEAISSTPREVIFQQLAQAAQQAYARGDENHPDWDEVARLIAELVPEKLCEHADQRMSPHKSVSQQADAVQLEYHFFFETLPAIKKSSIVAALRRPDNFRTAAISEKAAEEKEAWREAQSKFKKVCVYQLLDPLAPPYLLEDKEFMELSPFDAYLQSFQQQEDRSKIEAQLDAHHHDIMQGIIEANVCKKDFETRAFNEARITDGYKPLFSQIEAAKEKADPSVQHKWEQFRQQSAARCLEDIVQVGKIKLWQNRNQVVSTAKIAQRAYEKAEKFPPDQEGAALQTMLSPGIGEKRKAAQSAWEKRWEQLEKFQNELNAKRLSLGLTISTLIEKELETSLAEAQNAIKEWREYHLYAQRRIFNKSMEQVRSLYRIALEQYQHEQTLKKSGGVALARSNKEKYLALASKQYRRTMAFLEQHDTIFPTAPEWKNKIVQFQKEFERSSLFFAIAPFVKSSEQLAQLSQ